jgi:hypothetical protein
MSEFYVFDTKVGTFEKTTPVVLPEPKSDLERRYRQLSSNPSDINEHLPTLCKLASECRTVVDLGINSASPAFALTYGLSQSESLDKKLTMVYTSFTDQLAEIVRMGREEKLNVEFINAVSTVPVFTEPFDMVFIDTWHVYGHLKRELAKYAPITNKYIVMHDTSVDAVDGETRRCGMNVQQQTVLYNYPKDEIMRGIWSAIEEFLEGNKEWVLQRRFTNNNGLTILERK